MFGETLVVGIIKGFLSSFTSFLLDFFNQKRAEQTKEDLGRAKAEVDQANATIDAQQAQIDALANAPKTVSDAVRKLREGEA